MSMSVRDVYERHGIVLGSTLVYIGDTIDDKFVYGKNYVVTYLVISEDELYLDYNNDITKHDDDINLICVEVYRRWKTISIKEHFVTLQEYRERKIDVMLNS